MNPIRAYLGLGSNEGRRRQNLQRAMGLIDELDGVRVVGVSSYFDNPPVGGPAGQRAYLNAALAIDTTLGPRELLGACARVEDDLGRRREVRWGPRTIDIDILLYGEQVVNEPGLEIPHPRMHERMFVLVPLAELAPEAPHPVLGLTVGKLLERVVARKDAAPPETPPEKDA